MKIIDKIPNYLYAPCGVNCFNCHAFLRKKNPCSGCRSEDSKKPKHCLNCSKKTCLTEKNLLFCFECMKYPCTKIKSLHKNYKEKYNIDLSENDRIVKEHGIEYFMEMEKTRWTCDICGGIICQHDRICSDCGEKN